MSIGIALVLVFLVLQYYLSQSILPSLSFLSLFTQLIIFLNLFAVIFWLYKDRKYAIIPVLPLLLGYLCMGPFYKLSSKTTNADGLSILSYNVKHFYGIKAEDKKEGFRPPVVDFLEEQNTDIICLQEATYASKVYPILQEYPYQYVDVEDGGNKGARVVSSLYSKYPILHKERIVFPNSHNGAFYADLDYNGITIRIFNLHLQSYNVIPDVNNLQKEDSKRLVKRINQAIIKQETQAKIIRDYIDASPFPVLVIGDFNNTQFSNVYKTISSSLQDSFLEKGSQFGRTYSLFGIPIRIDFVLADDHFNIINHQNFTEVYSDHFPVKATVKLKSQQ